MCPRLTMRHLPFPKISFRSNIRETRWITRYILGIQWFIAKSILKRWCFLCRWYYSEGTRVATKSNNFFFLTSIKIFFRVISESKLRYIREMRVNAPVSTGVPSLTLRDAPVNSWWFNAPCRGEQRAVINLSFEAVFRYAYRL